MHPWVRNPLHIVLFAVIFAVMFVLEARNGRQACPPSTSNVAWRGATACLHHATSPPRALKPMELTNNGGIHEE
jgi:hypothetical protein